MRAIDSAEAAQILSEIVPMKCGDLGVASLGALLKRLAALDVVCSQDYRTAYYVLTGAPLMVHEEDAALDAALRKIRRGHERSPEWLYLLARLRDVNLTRMED